MLDRTIVKAVICAALSLWSARVRAQDEAIPAPDDARASVELSLSVAPQLLLSGLLSGGLLSGGLVSGASGLGGLSSGSSGVGNLGAAFPIVLDAGFALDPRAYLVVGLGGGLSESPGASSWHLNVPVSVLVYLDELHVGRVLPTLRVGGVLGWAGSVFADQRLELISGALLARGGATWLAARWIALRAEIGIDAGVMGAVTGGSFTSASIGFDASLGVLLRV